MQLIKIKIYKIIQSGGFLGKLLGPLLKTGLPLAAFSFEIQRYDQSEHQFNRFYSRNDLLNERKDVMHIINQNDTEFHWVSIYKNDKTTYFDPFGVEFIPKQTESFTGNYIIIVTVFRIQAYNLIKYPFFLGVRFAKFMLNNKS